MQVIAQGGQSPSLEPGFLTSSLGFLRSPSKMSYIIHFPEIWFLSLLSFPRVMIGSPRAKPPLRPRPSGLVSLQGASLQSYPPTPTVSVPFSIGNIFIYNKIMILCNCSYVALQSKCLKCQLCPLLHTFLRR